MPEVFLALEYRRRRKAATIIFVSEKEQASTIAEIPCGAHTESHAIIDGSSRAFSSDAEKFDALAQAWHEHQIGSPTLDFNHSAYHQIIRL